MRFVGVPLLTALLLLAGVQPARGQDAADAAWRAGDVATAERLYRERLLASPGDAVALHRVALAAAWAARYDESLQLFDKLLAIEPDDVEVRVDRARVLAWRGDFSGADAALRQVLLQDPSSVPALRALAQVTAWRGEYGAALEAYGRILELQPGDRPTLLDRAQTLARSAQLEAAIAAYHALLQSDPDDRDARLGLAQAYAWAGRQAAARAIYDALLRANPADPAARAGLARGLAWQGDLAGAERAWRVMLTADSADVQALTGLAQTLRWQGRPARAAAVLRRAQRIAPTDTEVRAQLVAVRHDLAPRTAAAQVYESDSDGNRVATLSLTASSHVVDRLRMHADAYLRRAEEARSEGTGLHAAGATVSAAWELDGGWLLSAGTGASTRDASGGTEPAWSRRVSVRSPLRSPVVGTLAYHRSALDASRALIERGVSTEEVSVSLAYRMAPRWSAEAAASVGTYEGTVRNRRMGANVVLEHRPVPELRLAAALRGFGFEKQVAEGYFSPDVYWLGELAGRWTRAVGRWALATEAAPGLQQAGSDTAPTGSVRVAGRVGYTIAPGREVGVDAAYSTAGLQQLGESAASAYRYTSLRLSGSWTF